MRKIDERIIRKLKKLLALSASDNENEATLAMIKAEEIMRKHNLSTVDVAMDGSGAYVQSKDIQGLTKRVQKWERALGISIANIFWGKAITIRFPGKGWKMTFVAGKTDLEIITDLYERLRRTIKRMSGEYVRNNPDPFISPRTLHNSYRIGMLITISERLQKLKENTQPSNTKNSYGITGKELMVVKDKAVEQRVKQMFPDLKMVSTRFSSVDAAAFEKGKIDGKTVNLNKSVHGRQPDVLGM